eukprot:GHVR01075568.1.p1 GENE.GHVR01075568.1~~GHVR01075568.1.p1  ORF type:complete len:354 (+),score=59.46 GHVR01075568.1:100-1161(+)
MKYSSIAINLISLLNIGLIKCDDTIYKIYQEILEGKVYAATHGDVKRIVKVAKDTREGELTSMARSKFIVEVFYNDRCSNLKFEFKGDSFPDRRITYINEIMSTSICLVIPYYAGGDMHSFAEAPTNNTLILNKLAGMWIEQMLMGVSLLHENNVLHNDIKELNIFVTKDKDIVIGDLGGGEVSVNGAGNGGKEFTYTPTHVSPERAHNILEQDSLVYQQLKKKDELSYETSTKSDIFSVGVIALNLCTGYVLDELFGAPMPLLDQNGLPVHDLENAWRLQYQRAFKVESLPSNKFKCAISNKTGETIDPKELIQAMMNEKFDERLSAKDVLTKYFNVTKEDDVRVSQGDTST